MKKASEQVLLTYTKIHKKILRNRIYITTIYQSSYLTILK